jgi:hypothetical protein
MPVYTQPVGFNTLPKVAVSGSPNYFYGSFARDTQDTLIQITSVARTGGTATVVGTITQGSIPITGNLVTIQGTATGSGAFNVSMLPITVSSVTSAGVITFTFTLSGTTVTTADGGFAYIPVQEVPEAVAANTSVAIYVPSQEPQDHGLRTITVATTFPTIQATTGAATVTLYTAINNTGIVPGASGSEWTSMGVVATVAAGAQTVGPLVTFTTPAGRFFCLQVTAITGTNTIISKVLV